MSQTSDQVWGTIRTYLATIGAVTVVAVALLLFTGLKSIPQLSFLNKIPSSFWGVIFGSLFSILAVYLTNRANDRRLQAQFDYERDIKKRDLEMSLRKDVYLAAVEAIYAGLGSIVRFANLDVPDDKVIEPYLEKAPVISKVHLIATSETIKYLENFTSELGVSYLKLMLERSQLIPMKHQIETLSTQIAIFAKEKENLLGIMKQCNLEGDTDPRRWNYLDSSFKNEEKRMADAIAKHTKLESDLRSRQLLLLKQCFSESTKLAKLVVPAMLAARKELELPIGEEAYRQAVEDSLAKQEAVLKNFIQQIAVRLKGPENV